MKLWNLNKRKVKMKLKKFKTERPVIEIKTNHPILARAKLVFFSIRHTKIFKIQPKVFVNGMDVRASKPVYRLFIPKYKIIKSDK